MAVHRHRVGHHDGVVEDSQNPLRDAGFSVARSAVQKQGLVPDQRRPKLVQKRVWKHQVAERTPQAFTAQLYVGCLRIHHLVVLLNGDRRRTCVLAYFIPRRCQRPARGGQGERVVVPQHSFHVQQLLLPELVKQRFEHRKGKLQNRVQGRQRA